MRTRLPLTFVIAIAGLSFGPQARAQDSAAVRTGGPTTHLPLAMTRTIKFTTDEGTWLDLDLSPDGRTIVFDLLGDLYTLPIAGGRATRITVGPAYDAQPRVSPDGRQIVFVSDRDGNENLWLANIDGSRLRMFTRGENARYQSPVWTRDGHIVVAKGRATPGPLPARLYDQRSYDLVLYDTAVAGTGIKLATSPTAAGATPASVLGPAPSADNRYIFFSAGRSVPGSAFASWQIVSLDRENGHLLTRTTSPRGAVRPFASPDGRWLVYGGRYEFGGQALFVQDLKTGDERLLLKDAQRDEEESIFSRDLMPSSAFTPDSRELIVYNHGHIWRVDLATSKMTMIPFTADVELAAAPTARFHYTIDDTALVVQQIRWPAPSPDGRTIAFTALSKLWTMELAAPPRSPRRLTTSDATEHMPIWSPDGRYVTYIVWSETSGGGIARAPAGGGQVEMLTHDSAYYERPVYSPDGRRIVALRSPRHSRYGRGGGGGAEIVWIPADGGEPRVIAPSVASTPQFTRDTSRVWVQEGASLHSMRWDGLDKREFVRVPGAQTLLIGPDGEHVIAQANLQVYLMTVPQVGEAPSISLAGGAAVPLRKVTTVGGEFLGWARDGKSFHFSLGHSFFRYDLARGDEAERTAEAARQAASDSTRPGGASARRPPAYTPERVDVVIPAKRDRPSGTVVLRGARVITMKGLEVIENGDVVVTDNRIAAVGKRGSARIPAGARIIDVSGKTILPGYVDTHAHLNLPGGVHREQAWSYLVNLAYGVTTTRDPQTGTTDVLAYGDLVATGAMLGPRVFSTGPGIFGTENITSLEDARNTITRYADFFNTRYIKQYGAGERKVRQWLIMAAREKNITSATEPYYDVKKNVTEAQDGYPDMAHGWPIFPIYKDLVQVLAQTGTSHTATLITTFGGPKGYDYFFTRRNLHDDPKLRRFFPHDELDRVAFRANTWYADNEFIFKQHGEGLKKMIDAGVLLTIGSHGNFQGAGYHWELEMHASGGVPMRDILHAATIGGATGLGLEKELGSLEPGKLADLQVLDKNPLDDVKNTTSIRNVMINGRLYDANTMDEIWPRQRKLGRQWWEDKPEP